MNRKGPEGRRFHVMKCHSAIVCHHPLPNLANRVHPSQFSIPSTCWAIGRYPLTGARHPELWPHIALCSRCPISARTGAVGPCSPNWDCMRDGTDLLHTRGRGEAWVTLTVAYLGFASAVFVRLHSGVPVTQPGDLKHGSAGFLKRSAISCAIRENRN